VMHKRVFSILVLLGCLCLSQVSAWGFGAEEEAVDRRGSRDAQEGPSADRSQEPLEDSPRRRAQGGKGPSKIDRQKQKEEAVKMRSRSKDEMLSDAYNREVAADDLLDTETPEDNDYLSDD